MAEVKSTYSADAIAALRMLGGRTIAYQPGFARMYGIKGGVMLCQLIYWDEKGYDPDGWIFKTCSEMEEETALSEHEQETARARLKGAGVIEYERRGLPAMPCYRVNFARLMADIVQYQQDRRKAPNKTAAKQIGGKRLSSEAGNSGDLIGGKRLTYPQNTPDKITSEEKEKEESGASAPAPAPSAPQTTAGTPSSSDDSAGAYTRSRVITLQDSGSDNNNAGGDGSGKNKRKREPKLSPANLTEHADTRVQLYLDRIKPEITPTNAERILSRVSVDYLEQWEEAVLVHATGNGRGSSYDPDDFVILFDLYDKRVRAKKAEKAYAEMQSRKPAAPASAARPAPVSPIAARLNARGFATRP